ncbi:TonB-dependent receptor domain-containing protein [Vibrio superstes]|uniref:Ligand-gated channel protein n=1 Tax=Vibrio superstes NBRC 103154 TaxID=1219062 RepID=A0A511QNI5_9VIBR|nr:TonB-dependent receptor [Vibrio superstes]GEM78894.1 ligand-gated channel protein [Vibrio superstes NBRC 103154]
MSSAIFHRTPLAVVISGVATTLSLPTFAESNTEPMETLVVTAAGYEQTVTQAPASISVIDREQIENRAYQDLTDALRDIPGVTVTGGGSRQDISLRGMPPEYTAILVDGRKQTGRETQPSSSGGFEQDWLPPLNAIERIEVVRGPMSTLYGSDAIGGVINIITRKDYQQWHGNLRAETILQENSNSGNTYQGELYLAGPLIDGLLSASLTGMYQERKEDNIENGNGGKELDNYRASVHLTPTDNDTFSFDYTSHDQKRFNTDGKSTNRGSTETNNNRESYSLSHSGSYLWGDATSYVTQEVVENVGRELEVENTNFNSQWSVPLGDHFVTAGIAYSKQALDNNEFVFKNSQWSLYAENEWYMMQDFALTLGLRYDDNENFQSQLSPRVYGVWNVDTDWVIKGGVSTGYRAPSLTEMEEEWEQESCRGNCVVYGNSDLKAESSVNSEIGFYYAGGNTLTSSMTFFYSDFKDKINLRQLDDNCSGDCDKTYENVDEAITYGSEFTVARNITTDVRLAANYTYTYSEKKSGEDKGQPLTQMPEHLASVNADWKVRDNVNTWTRVAYRSEENDNISINSTRTLAPSITYVDIGANWRINNNVKLMAAIYNLFDQETSYEEYGYVEDGRRYWIAIDTSF